MAKKLKLIPDDDFYLLGLIAREKDYKLVFAINQQLDISLEKQDHLVIRPARDDEYHEFTRYATAMDESEREIFILGNKNGSHLLVPEQKAMDYFMLLRGPFQDDEIRSTIEQLKQIRMILGVYEIPMKKLKSKQHLVF